MKHSSFIGIRWIVSKIKARGFPSFVETFLVLFLISVVGTAMVAVSKLPSTEELSCAVLLQCPDSADEANVPGSLWFSKMLEHILTSEIDLKF